MPEIHKLPAVCPCGTVRCSPSCCLHEGCPALSRCSSFPLFPKPPPNQLPDLQPFFSIYLPGTQFLQRACDFWFSLQKMWMCTLIPSLHSWRKHVVLILTEFLNTATLWDASLRSHHRMCSTGLLAHCTAEARNAAVVSAEQGKAYKESSTSGTGCWWEET